MRLIDADALIAKQANIAKTFARSDAQKSIIGRVMYNTEKSPTIDAIPVEWMESKRKEALHDGMRSDEVEAVEMVLWMWQKEQEAR